MRHDVQFDCRNEHVRQFDVHATQTLLTPTNPGVQVATQRLPYKFRLIQAVQL